MRFTEAFTCPFAKIRATAIAVTLGVLAGAATPALADNPLGLIDPATISVGTMGRCQALCLHHR